MKIEALLAAIVAALSAALCVVVALSIRQPVLVINPPETAPQCKCSAPLVESPAQPTSTVSPPAPPQPPEPSPPPQPPVPRPAPVPRSGPSPQFGSFKSSEIRWTPQQSNTPLRFQPPPVPVDFASPPIPITPKPSVDFESPPIPTQTQAGTRAENILKHAEEPNPGCETEPTSLSGVALQAAQKAVERRASLPEWMSK